MVQNARLSLIEICIAFLGCGRVRELAEKNLESPVTDTQREQAQ